MSNKASQLLPDWLRRYTWKYGNGRTRNAMQRSVYIQVCQLSFKVEWPRHKWHYPKWPEHLWQPMDCHLWACQCVLGPWRSGGCNLFRGMPYWPRSARCHRFHMILTYFKHLFWVMWRHLNIEAGAHCFSLVFIYFSSVAFVMGSGAAKWALASGFANCTRCIAKWCVLMCGACNMFTACVQLIQIVLSLICSSAGGAWVVRSGS